MRETVASVIGKQQILLSFLRLYLIHTAHPISFSQQLENLLSAGYLNLNYFRFFRLFRRMKNWTHKYNFKLSVTQAFSGTTFFREKKRQNKNKKEKHFMLYSFTEENVIKIQV